MRRMTNWTLVALAAFVSVGGACGGDDSSGGSSSGATSGTTTGEQPPEATIDITADTNRDGVANPADPADQDGEDVWDASHGAVFLTNVDDDDGDEIRDVDDEIINGEADLADLARVFVSAWADAPDGATGVLTLDDLGAGNVRLWKHGLDGNWVLVGGGLGACNDPAASCQVVPVVNFSTDEVRAGLEFGVEALKFHMSSADGEWTGMLDVKYSIIDPATGAPTASTAVPDGIDLLKMRVAPWMLWGNLSPFDRVWSSDDSSEFVNGIQDATNEAGIDYETYGNWGDQWTQDFFQTGYITMPGPNGTVQGMRIANARPWGRSNADSQLPIKWLSRNYLGPDQGIYEVYKKPHTGDSYDSHGNHDLIPPYTNGDQSFPQGRIFVGSGVLKETRAFYDAQGPQSPHFNVDTSWLFVGHIDEVFSYVPANTPRGWKLLVASGRLAKQMLEEQSAAGNGSVVMFQGLKWYANVNTSSLTDASQTIDELLADTQVMADNDDAQAEIDIILDDFIQEMGLAADEVIEIPFITHQTGYGMVAHSPGTVNSLVFGDYIVHPDPFGPVIDGEDMWKTDLYARLGTAFYGLGKDGQGLKVRFTDDWYTYHILDGEVHCGSNPEALPDTFAWWETGR